MSATTRWTWATVTQTSPLQILLDGDVSALTGTPIDLTGGGAVIDRRVWVQVVGGAVVIHGVAGGPVPPGTVEPWPVGGSRAGWAVCDGSTKSRTAVGERALYEVIGTTHGVGDGITTFNLPDYRDRALIGAGTDSVGASVGEAEHTLTLDEIPSHDHGGVTGTSTVTANVGTSDSSTNPDSAATLDRASGAGDATNRVVALSGHSHSVSSAGGGQSHNNVPPSGVVQWMIKL